MDTEQKNQVLSSLTRLLAANQARIIEVNQQDISACGDIDPSMLDRLKVDEKKVEGSNKAMNIKVGTVEVRAVEGNVSTGTVISKTLELENNMKLGEGL